MQDKAKTDGKDADSDHFEDEEYIIEYDRDIIQAKITEKIEGLLANDSVDVQE